MSKTSFTLQELSELCSAELSGNPNSIINGVAALDNATSSDASFLANHRYRDALQKTKAGVICIDENVEKTPEKNYLISKDPSRTFQKIIAILQPNELFNSGFESPHPSAVIHPSAKIGNNVFIGPHVVIDKNVTIGDNTTLTAQVYIGPQSTVGQSCNFHPGSIVREGCQIGNRVILQPGCVIGSCGYGYIPNNLGHHQKLEQLGIVVLEDDVEIGANTTIDRARFKETRIRRGSKIDNLVQIAHNVEIGEDNLIISQVGIAGSTKTGRHVCLAGQTGVVGHVEIGDGVIVASKGGVSKSMPTAGTYAGVPVMPLREHNEQQVHLRKITTYVKKLKELEKQVASLQNKLD